MSRNEKRQSMMGGEVQGGERIVMHNFPVMITNCIAAATTEKRKEFTAILLKAIDYEIEEARRSAPQEPVASLEVPEDRDIIERAAWILDCYHAHLQQLSPIDFDEHPYIPEIEGTAKDLRAMLAPSPQEASAVDHVRLLCPRCHSDRMKEPCGNPSDCGMIGTAQQATHANAAAANGDGLRNREAYRALLAVLDTYLTPNDYGGLEVGKHYESEVTQAIEAARIALSVQPKPVAWMNPDESCVMDAFLWSVDPQNPRYRIPVYTVREPAADADRQKGEAA